MTQKVVRIFMWPQQFPCGPQSSCCGPIGQSEEEIAQLKGALERELGCPVEVINASNASQMREHLQVLRFIRAFGVQALPIITLDDEIVSMGQPSPEQAISTLKEKVSQP